MVVLHNLVRLREVARKHKNESIRERHLEMQNTQVTSPREVVDFLRRDENRNRFGEGKEITHCYFPPTGSVCVQFRQFFSGDNLGNALHYEVFAGGGGRGRGQWLVVEIHSEVGTPSDVHQYILTQFENHGLKNRSRSKAYRFASQEIPWRNRCLGEVLGDIKAAVDGLYQKYDEYLGSVEEYYANNESLEGCMSYDAFMREKKRTNNGDARQ